MRRPIAFAVAAAVAATGLVMLAEPAAAAPNKSCRAGGFTGTIWMTGSARNDTKAYYAIDKGSNDGGNKANINMWDYGHQPTKTFSTGQGIQDGRFHLLGGPYDRVHGDVRVIFQFDKSGPDPSCTLRFTL